MNFKQNSLLLVLLVLCINFNKVLLKFTQENANALQKWTDVGMKSAALANNNQDLKAAIILIDTLGQAIPYAGPLATLISGILNLGTKSELSIVMDKLEQMNGKLDRLDERIDEVLRKIESTQSLVLFKSKLEHLNNLKLFYKRFAKTPHSSTKTDFRRECDSNNMLKFFKWIETEVKGATFLSLRTIMLEGMDMKNFNEWSNRIAAVLSEAMFLHVTCVGASSENQQSIEQILQGDKQILNEVIKNVKNEFHKGNKFIKQNFFLHAKSEIESLLRDHTKWGNKDISNLVYEHLNSKYYWRKWGAFAWNDDTTTEYQHWIMHLNSNSWYWHHKHNRCFLAGSVLRYPDVSLESEIGRCHEAFYEENSDYRPNDKFTAEMINKFLTDCIGKKNLDSLAVVRFSHGLRGYGGDGFFKNANFPDRSARGRSDYSVIAIPNDSSPYENGEVCESNGNYCGGDYHCCENNKKCCPD